MKNIRKRSTQTLLRKHRYLNRKPYGVISMRELDEMYHIYKELQRRKGRKWSERRKRWVMIKKKRKR